MNTPTFTARTPVDLIAMAPVVLGFHPEDSIVLLTFGGPPGRQFHARVDLPVTDDLAEVVELLAGPVRRHDIGTAAVLVYSDDVQLARCAAEALAPALADTGCRVVDVLRVDDECYDRPLDPEFVPVPYDISSHAFTAQAVFLGRQTLSSRSELADQLVGGTLEEIEEVRAAAAAAAESRLQRPGGRTQVQALIRGWLAGREPLDPQDCGALLFLLGDLTLRDAAWDEITPETCRPLIEFWSQLLRRCPEELLPGPAALLGFSAWLAGEGALAWCAVDRCLGQDPDYSLGHLLGGMLEQAVPPHVWNASRSARSA